MSSPDGGSALLVVIGEPLTDAQSMAITQRVVEGLSAWDSEKSAHADLSTELLNLINKNVEAEVVETGGSVLRSNGSQIYIEFLIGPTVQTLNSSLLNFLTNSASYKHLAHAGPAFSGSGSWILRDGTFSFHDLARMIHRPDVVTALTDLGSSACLSISCFPEGEWAEQGVKYHGLDKHCKISVGIVNGSTSVDSSCALGLQRYLEKFVSYVSLKSLMPRAHLVGSIRFRRPTIYIFPSGQGDAALFGVDGFLMVLDGGFQRKTCFWDFLSHVDHLDAILISRFNSSNVFGTTSFLDLLASTGCAPKLGYAFGNVPSNGKTASMGPGQDRNPLLVSLYDEGSKVHDKLARLGLKLQPCTYAPPPVTAKHPESLTLYEKVGQGRLEMYVLNPLKESKEYAEFIDSWKKRVQKVAVCKFSTMPGSESGDYAIPLTNRTSMAVLIVWRPADPTERIVRVLYPGSCPQDKILNGLEKLKNLDCLKYPYCSGSLLEKKLPAAAAGMKAALMTKKPPAGKTAAELMAEGAKFSLASPKKPSGASSKPPSRDTPLTSPPSNSQAQSPTQGQSPQAESDGECGNMVNENGDDSKGEYNDAIYLGNGNAGGDRAHVAGYSAEAEPAQPCAYESIDVEGEEKASAVLVHTRLDETGDGTGSVEKLDVINEEPAVVHSALNPDAPPFYPKSSQSGEDSSPETIRKERNWSKMEMEGNTMEQEHEEVFGWNDGNERALNQRNVDDLRNEWGQPLGLPTLPNKKETHTASAKTNGPAKPTGKTSNASTTRQATTKMTGRTTSLPAKANTNTNSTAKSPSPKSSPTVPSARATSKTSQQARKLSAPGMTRSAGIGNKTMTGMKKPMATLTPCYVDLAYVPHQGNPFYCNADFFKFIRSKYYVFSSLNPSKETLDALLSGKKSWACQDESVTIIPTYDSSTLTLWMGLHKDELAFENIDVAPSCARCSVNLEEPAGATCAAYRLEL